MKDEPRDFARLVVDRRVSRRDALRWGVVGLGALAAPGVLGACGSSSSSGAGGSTGTGAAAPSPASLRPYDANVAAGPATDLARTFAFPGAYTDPASLSLSRALDASTASLGFDYVTAASDGDLPKLTSQMDSMLARGFCATFMYPTNEQATRPLAQRALDAGACVFGGAARPYSTCQINQDQALTGQQIGKAAADWIREQLGGRAQVVHFNEDSTETLIPRHRATIAELKKVGPGVEIVSDIEVKIDPEAGANAISTILQAHPGANVILGGSAPIGGVYSVFDSKGRGKDPGIALFSVAGSDSDLELIAAGDTIYRGTLTEPWPIYGWAMGVFGVEWQKGGSIPRLMSPQGTDALLTSAEAIRTYRADMADPGRTWETKGDAYVALWGNIDYRTRDSYWRVSAAPPSTVAGTRE